jgi:uncharacterized membrane protein HdeD (DUF308 family)
MNEARRDTSAPWGLLLAAGVLTALFGLILILNPFDSLRVVTAMIGVLLLIAGIAGVAAGWGRGAAGSAGPVVAIIGGLILLILPGITLQVLAVVVGLILLVWGIVSVVVALRDRRPGQGGSVLGGVALALLGLVVVVWPGPTLALITLLVGVGVLLFGVALIVQALRLRS